MSCIQAGETRQRRVAILLDIISCRSEKNFKSFLNALVKVDQESFAVLLDERIANEFIHQRDTERDIARGMIEMVTVVNCGMCS